MPAVAVDTHAIVWYLANDPRLSSRAADAMDLDMLTMKRKPASVGELLIEGFMEPLGLTQSALAEAMGVPRKHVNELCNNRRSVTARPHSFSRVFSATAPSSGSTSNGGAISGKRYRLPRVTRSASVSRRWSRRGRSETPTLRQAN